MFRLTYVTSFREYAQRSCLVINTVELCYNDLGLCDISAITLYILRYGLIPQCHVLFCLASYDVHTSTTSDITTLPVFSSNTIFQELNHFDNVAISSFLSRKLHKFQASTMTKVKVISLCVKYPSTSLLLHITGD